MTVWTADGHRLTGEQAAAQDAADYAMALLITAPSTDRALAGHPWGNDDADDADDIGYRKWARYQLGELP